MRDLEVARAYLLGPRLYRLVERRGRVEDCLACRFQFLTCGLDVSDRQLDVFEQTAVSVEGDHVLLDIRAELFLGGGDVDLCPDPARREDDGADRGYGQVLEMAVQVV